MTAPDPERIRATLRLLLASGDITPMGARMIEQVLRHSDPKEGTG